MHSTLSQFSNSGIKGSVLSVWETFFSYYLPESTEMLPTKKHSNEDLVWLTCLWASRRVFSLIYSLTFLEKQVARSKINKKFDSSALETSWVVCCVYKSINLQRSLLARISLLINFRFTWQFLAIQHSTWSIGGKSIYMQNGMPHKWVKIQAHTVYVIVNAGFH